MSTERAGQYGQAHAACRTEFQYAVKLVCGEVASTPPSQMAPGRYWTAINIHNPDHCHEARLRWKVCIADSMRPGPVTGYADLPGLGPDRALEIDCPDVARFLQVQFPQQPPLKFVKGYVVIASDIEVDVVAVYSGAQGVDGFLNSFHTERIQPRCVPVCADMALPLHTGIADWRTVSPQPAAPVAVVSPLSPLWTTPPPFGSKWVSQFVSDGQSTNPNPILRYELCFDLCFGFTMPAPPFAVPFAIQMMADEKAQLFLNNTPIGTVPAPGYTQITTITPTTLAQLLKAGRNCFAVQVNNQQGGGATGFAMAALLQVVGGKCPCSSALPIAGPQPKIH